MIKLETLEILTNHVACPNCNSLALQVNLSCTTPKSPCDYIVGCDHCHYNFHVSHDTESMSPVWEQFKHFLGDSSCPQCGDNKFQLEFLCDALSKNCFFMVRCENNNHYSRLDQNGLRALSLAR